MTDDTIQRTQDAEEHLKSYKMIMKAGSEIGVPISLAATMFATSIVMANGMWLSLFLGVITYVFVYFVVKAFFSH